LDEGFTEEEETVAMGDNRLRIGGEGEACWGRGGQVECSERRRWPRDTRSFAVNAIRMKNIADAINTA
jgi:hypothetical protein